MKAILCYFTVFCTLYTSAVDVTDPSHILARRVNVQKRNVESVINDLMRYEREVYNRIEMQMNEIKSGSMLSIEKTIKLTHDDIRQSITNSDISEKDGEVCLRTAVTQLETLSQNGYSMLDTCSKNSLTIIEAPIRNMANTVKTGKEIIIDLDAIIPDCYSPIFIKMQNCVLRKTYLMKTSVKKLETNAKAVKKTATSSSISALTQARTCSTKAVSDVRTGTTNVRVNVGTCIRSA